VPRQAGTGLRITRRSDRAGVFTIEGRVAGQRIRKRAASDNFRLAQEEAAALEAELLRSEWHGPRRGVKSFAQAVELYLETKERSASTRARLGQLVRAAGPDLRLKDIDQAWINKLAKRLLRPDAAPDTKRRGIIVPVRAVMTLAAKQRWCDRPEFDGPDETPQSRCLFLLPHEALELVAACGPALSVLTRFIIGTGARMSEALEVEWEDVDLAAGKVIFWRTKTRRRRVAALPPATVAMLASLPAKDGRVIRRPDGEPYADRERQGGGQTKTAWRAAKRRAGTNPELTQHDLRHTWASWFYAIHKDPERLRVEGGWSSLDQVGVYLHLLPEGYEDAIRAFWGLPATKEGFGHQTATKPRRSRVKA